MTTVRPTNLTPPASHHEPNGTSVGIWAIGAGHATTHAFSAAFYLLLPSVAQDFHLTFSQIGLLISLRQVMSFLVNLPAGFIVDTVGKRRLLMGLSLSLAVGPYLIVAATARYPVLLLSMVLIGVGVFLWHPAAITSISEMYPTRRGFGLAIHEVGANLGDTLAPLGTGLLLGYLAWRRLLALSVIAGLVLALLLLRLVVGGRNRGKETAGGMSLHAYAEGIRAMTSNASLLILTAVSGVRSLTQQGLSTFLPLYLARDLKMPAALLGAYLTMVQASGMIATPLAGTLSDRLGPKRVATAGMVATSLALIAFAAFRRGAAFVTALAFLGFFLYSMRPAIFRWAIGLTPRQYEGTAVGVLFTSQALFSTLMPLIGGVVADRYGLLPVFYVIAGAVVVANFGVFAVPDLHRPAARGKKTA